MKLPELSVKRRVTFLMFFVFIFGTGIFGLTQLGVDMYPDMEFPLIMVISSMEGAGPEEIENLVTDPLEQAMARVSNVKKVTSTSRPGISIVTAEFNWGHSLEQAETDVRRQLDMFEGMLPDDATEPLIFALDPSMQPVFYVGFSSEVLNDFDLRTLVHEEIEPLFSRLDGVGSATTIGGRQRQINVKINPSALVEYGVTASQVVGSLSAVRNNTPAGRIESGGMDMTIRIESAFHNVEEIEQLVVGMNQGSPVLLRDVAEVEDGEAEVRQYVRSDGEPAIFMYINKRSDANTVNVCARIRDQLDEITGDYRGMLTPMVAFDQSEFIELSINNLSNTAIEASILAFLVLLFFLRSWRGSAITGIAIPISVVVTFAVMHFTDVQLNLISLAGLALAIGLLVDNAIVVLENIFRHREAGETPIQAAINGALEVSNAITASTLTTLAVFVPILFVPGLAGQLFREMVLTITFSLTVSLFVALSLVPLISSWVKKLAPKHKPGSIPARLQSMIARLEERYSRLVSWAVNHKKFVIFTTLGVFVLAILTLGQLPSEFFPESDDGFIMMDIELPIGTSLETTDEVVRAVEDSIKAIIPPEELKAVFSTVGEGEGVMAIFASSGSNAAEVNIRLSSPSERSTSMFEYQDRIREVLREMPGVDYSSEAGMSIMSGSPIEITLYGDNLQQLYEKGEEIKEAIASIEGVADPTTSMEDRIPEYTFAPDPVRMSLLGVNQNQLAMDIRYAFQGSNASIFREDDEEYNINVRFPEPMRDSREDLQYAPVLGRQLISLGTLEQRMISNVITRTNQARMVTISCDISGGYSLGEVASKVLTTLREMDTSGFRYEIGGEMEDQRETFMYLGIAILVAALLVYMVMAGQFESFLEPFIIIFTLPLAFIGVVLALFITATPLSVMAIVGMLMLAGIVVNNGIVMVDYANQLRRQGRTLKESIVEASTTRMRPIMMTAATTILAMIPLALGIGEGAENWAPMAITVIGGLFVATILTLVVEPCIYVVFGCYKRFKGRNGNGDGKAC
ncbi:MAG: AcrB/AcrD/AcrF family protein [Candidatus Aegiribacteria sp.]|nr:AcrB/AcrD/AcrF family protein [Candidatus Aegiribacteria sp.]MBD3294629.1 AcrB/AcrD/AcrF family protein [Candidatus Fermentibacteria bacterium]